VVKCTVLHMYLATEAHFLFQLCCVSMALGDIQNGEGRMSLDKTYCCTLGHSVLNLQTEFNRRVKRRASLFCTLCVGSGNIAQCSNEYRTTYIIDSNRRKVYAVNMLLITSV